MTNYWTETVSRLTPYVPGVQRSGAGIVKLNTNENPYPPSPKVMEAIAAVNGDQLRRYPDPESVALRTALAEYHGLDISQVFVGNGSDEILALAFLAYFTNHKVLQFPDISYSFYPVYCDLYGIQARTVPLSDDYVLPVERFEPNAGGIVFPNPNAPTARAVDESSIAGLLVRHTEQVLLVDEAYADFGATSVVSLVKRFPNLLVSQTYSKGRSLAGMRLGVAFGHPTLIEGLQRVKNSFNSYPVDAVAQAAGIASLGDEAYYRQTIEQILRTRRQAVTDLQNRGFEVLPSAANFLFARAPGDEAGRIFRKLDDAGVLVRYWDKPRLNQWLRISMGTDDEMQRLMSALDA
ncbi:pyridoxal phosphate-dependent aminotransferase [Granulosicoccus sp. 3-233]|uniref:pyridoxal phosphate-dependent aminotransferase n=1 Tax=Granulosicoccus sp. 3-233 TaxID=3417969 RepID=UPI003D33164C